MGVCLTVCSETWLAFGDKSDTGACDVHLGFLSLDSLSVFFIFISSHFIQQAAFGIY